MEEKILIKSKLDETAKKVFLCIIFGLLFLAFIFLVSGIVTGVKRWNNDQNFYYLLYGYHPSALEIIDTIFFAGLACLIIHWSLIFLAGIVAIAYWGFSTCEFVLTDKNVTGKTLFGKKVILPIHMISAYSTRRFLSMITISTASGFTKFSMIENYKDIENILQTLINERQANTEMSVSRVPTKSSDKFDDLKKFKQLLDNGIITQEEFEAKKKQLLDL